MRDNSDSRDGDVVRRLPVSNGPGRLARTPLKREYDRDKGSGRSPAGGPAEALTEATTSAKEVKVRSGPSPEDPVGTAGHESQVAAGAPAGALAKAPAGSGSWRRVMGAVALVLAGVLLFVLGFLTALVLTGALFGGGPHA